MHDVNKQSSISKKHTHHFHVQTTLSVREKQSFLTMKIDNNSLLLLHNACSLSDQEFLLLYDMNKSNLILPYWNYPKFNLDSLENDECVSEFRFEKKDAYILGETLENVEPIICYNGTKVDGIESLCIFLKRFAFPCRYSDMIS